MNPTFSPTQGSSYTPYSFTPIGASPPDQSTNNNVVQQGQQALAQLNSFTNKQPQSNQTVQTEPQHGSWLTRLLPTAGSIIGGLVTAPLELAPGVGTAANIAGAGAGGALGKFLENKLEGTDATSGVAASGLEGSIGQGVGGVLGKLGQSALGTIGNLSEKGASKLVQGQFLKGTLDNPTAQTLGNMGITNAKQVADIAPIVTGSNGALANGVRNGLQEADMGVNISHLPDVAKNLVGENQMQLSPSSFKNINQTVQGALLKSVGPGDVTQLATKGASGPVNTFAPGALNNVLPENAFNVTKNFEQLAQSAKQGAFDKMGNVVNTDQLAKYRIFNGLASEARSAAFGGETPIPLSEANKALIIEGLAPMKAVNPQAYNWHVNQVTNAQNLQDLRPIQAPMVRANQALNTTENVESANAGSTVGQMIKSAAPVAGGMAGGPVGAVAGMVPSMVNTQMADKLGAAGLSKLADVAGSEKLSNAVLPTLQGISQVIAHSPNYVPSTAGTNATQGGTMAPNQYQTSPMDVSQGPLGSYLGEGNQALQLGINAMLNPYSSQGAGEVTSGAGIINAILPVLQKQQAAQEALQSLESSYAAAGGAQGRIGGLLSHLGGLVTGGPAATYGAQASQAAKQLSDLGIPVNSIPQITNTPEAAQQGFGYIQNVLNALGGGGMNPGLLGGIPASQ